MQSAREVAIKSVCTDTHTIQVHWHATAAFSPFKGVRTYQLSNFMSSSGFFVFNSALSLIAWGYNFKTLSKSFASASRKKVDVSFAVAIVNVLNVQHCVFSLAIAPNSTRRQHLANWAQSPHSPPSCTVNLVMTFDIIIRNMLISSAFLLVKLLFGLILYRNWTNDPIYFTFPGFQPIWVRL